MNQIQVKVLIKRALWYEFISTTLMNLQLLKLISTDSAIKILTKLYPYAYKYKNGNGKWKTFKLKMQE